MKAPQFRAWMKRNGYTIARAAEEFGLSPRLIAYYRSGEQPIPKVVELACAQLNLRKGKP